MPTDREVGTGYIMDDSKIVDLFFDRDERAISESDRKYGRMLSSISFSLLGSSEDAEECVNDTYLDAWGAIPPARPLHLGAFLSKIVRRISIDRYRHKHREKRGGIEELCEELSDAIPSGVSVYDEYENGRLKDALNEFLSLQDKEKRVVFVLRYFYLKPVGEIAIRVGASESKVKTMLHRMRESLKTFLERRDLF
ncbi:MAG: RNA polymerase sigma factor [Clostridia bacterium]|nr:RNA polymerase sigma factor [Clostridia bacterium]